MMYTLYLLLFGAKRTSSLIVRISLTEVLLAPSISITSREFPLAILAQLEQTPQGESDCPFSQLRDLARINQVKTSTHASVAVQGLAGLGQNGFDNTQRYQALKEIKKLLISHLKQQQVAQLLSIQENGTEQFLKIGATKVSKVTLKKIKICF